MTKAFDVYVGVDWSGAEKPVQTHAVTWSSCRQNMGAPEYHAGKLSRTDVYNKILAIADTNDRTFIGIDCNFGYAYHVGQKQFGAGADYKTLWARVDHVNKEHDNFFAGNFWRTKQYAKYFWTEGAQPDWFDAERLQRKTEKQSTIQGNGRPESPFKLIGAKQVGKGGLAGMRMAYALKQALRDKIAFWPFEAEKIDQAQIVVSEIYPRLFIRHSGFGNKKIRDQAYMNVILKHFDASSLEDQTPLSDHHTDAIIASAGIRWFINNQDSLNIECFPKESLDFEGWIFGVDPY